VFLDQYAARIEAERLAQPATGGCLWCPDFRPTGTLEQTRQACADHRAEHHPDAKSTRRKQRVMPMHHGSRPVGENIANARAQGAATWDGAA
jgi:hypothetical protein